VGTKVKRCDVSPTLVHAIHSHFPNDNFVGEESANALRADSTLLEAVWSLVSDPESDAVLDSVPSREGILRVIDLGGTGAGEGTAAYG